MPRDREIHDRLQRALEDAARLREENTRLRAMLGLAVEEKSSGRESMVSEPPASQTPAPTVTNQSPPGVKVALFRSLFRGREDVYPIRWETKKAGKSGYSPACALEWKRPLCGKPRVKCGNCKHRKLIPVTDAVIQDHLLGKHTIGVYPLLPDETCWFIAMDFDKGTWQEHVAAFRETWHEARVPAVLERSRSGNGAHVWIFFESPIQASLARKLGCALLTRTMERRPEMGLDSYDRLFPNQDTMPKGGFGSLIALPLQRGPRDKGNSVFLDWQFDLYPDQWRFLSGIQRMTFREVERVVEEASWSGGVMGVRMSLTDESAEEEDPWTRPPSRRRKEAPISGPFPEAVRLLRSNMLYLEKEGLPPALLNRLFRLAAFQNPAFYQAQVMRLPTYDIPRVIGCGEDFLKHIALPRGCLEEVEGLFRTLGIQVDEMDERFGGLSIDVAFHGDLRSLQQEATRTLLAHDTGILSASTAFGKTVVAIRMIAARRVNTLVLVHRRQLLDQWRKRLSEFLEIPVEQIGQIGGGKTNRTGLIDVAILQSVVRKGEVKDLVAEYGHVIVDECHHIPAFSFEQVLKQVKAQYVLGLTATPIRKDGHHPILVMQCGPIRFRESARKGASARPFEHMVVPRETGFKMPWGIEAPSIQEVYAAMSTDARRNQQILDDLLNALESGRSPLLLTQRIEHLEFLSQKLAGFAKNLIVLKGGMGKRQRHDVAERRAHIPDEEERVLLATGPYIGEGFDDARLDTLFLAMPISWRGTLQQYVGRLHRLHEGKRVVQVYDYVDTHVPMLMKMYERRLRGYEAMGYSVQQGAKI